MKSAIVIPARLQSTRLPRKLLLSETGKTLLQHTYESAFAAQLPESIVVAADNSEIVAAVSEFGGNVMLTDPNHPSGTDRVAEIAAGMNDVEIFVNVQGDEPEISGHAIDLAIRTLMENPAAVMATLATPIRTRSQLNDPSCVKVVMDSKKRAMYFSRSPIPCAREWNDEWLESESANFFQHVGLYAYRREFLLRIPALPKCQLEAIESLEQLRVLDAGFPIFVGLVDHPIAGIDTAEDYASFVDRQSS